MVKSILDGSGRFVGHVSGSDGEFYARPFGTKKYFGPYHELWIAELKVRDLHREIFSQAKESVAPSHLQSVLPLFTEADLTAARKNGFL